REPNRKQRRSASSMNRRNRTDRTRLWQTLFRREKRTPGLTKNIPDICGELWRLRRGMQEEEENAERPTPNIQCRMQRKTVRAALYSALSLLSALSIRRFLQCLWFSRNHSTNFGSPT